jgi:ferritin
MYTDTKPFYPENAYCVILGYIENPVIPADAEETLEYLLKTLTPQEADMFTRYFKDEMTHVEIGKIYNFKKQKVQQIILKAIRKLSLPSRSKILAVGREEYLKFTVSANAEEKKRYFARILELEQLIRKQIDAISDSSDKVTMNFTDSILES